MQFIDLGAQAARIEDKILARFKTIIQQSSYILGHEITQLEDELARFVGVEHALTMSSGTDALLVALMALQIGPGDEVITSPFSFFATAEVIALLGATPVFVDIVPDTYTLDVTQLEAAITAKTKAIMPVNLYGQCADFDAINALATRYQLPVIEDAAQSFGAVYKDRRSCALSTIGCTSFFPSKPLGCYGDGGACFTNDPELAQRMHEIRLHGQSKRYFHTRLGINARMDTMQAAVLLEKLVIFPEEIEQRQQVAARYQQMLPDSLKKPLIQSHNLSVYAQYTIETAERDALQKCLQAKGIPTAVHYPLGLHQQPIIQTMYPCNQSFPHTERAARRVMSLPMHPYLLVQDQHRIVHAVNEALSEIAAVS